METEWFKNAVIYGVNVSTFYDADGDGVGDFRGLTSKLDYLAELGVNCLWILPFYPSPRRDNGYDVTNYFGIDQRYGTIDDFRDLIATAEGHGIRIMIDLVVHHTSDRHPWFEAARSDRHSSYRDYYIWSDELPAGLTEQSFFPEVESGVWRHDPVSQSYYRHGFYHFQPDLNFANQRVQDEVFAIVDFWLALGVSGFRLDAANHIVGPKSLPKTGLDDPGAFWQRIRQFITSRRPGAVLLAEADMLMSEINNYVIDGRGIHMLLNFWTNQTMMHALATGRAAPLMGTLAALPTMPLGAQYVNFLRNLDELNIEKLSTDEQQEIYSEFGATKRMQIYGRGIRRRLAPMLEGNQQRLKLAFSLLFSMPGTPLLVYGDEIGLGENLDLEERDSVRTPMQWTSGLNGGFSESHSSSIIQRAVLDPRYHHEHLNVADQLQQPESLLSFMKRLIALRKAYPTIGIDRLATIKADQPSVVIFKFRNGSSHLVTLHNLAGDDCIVQPADPQELDGLREVFNDREYHDKRRDSLKLHGYGWRWFARD